MEFAVKPALLAATRNYVLTETAITASDANGGAHWRLSWDEITGAAVVDTTIRGARMRRLDLISPAATHSISTTTGPGDEAPEFHALAAATLARLGDTPTTIGEHGKSRLAMFAIGALTLLAGLGLGGAALATVSGDRLGAVAVPVAMMVMLGLYFAGTNAPWKKPPRLPASALVPLLAGKSG